MSFSKEGLDATPVRQLRGHVKTTGVTCSAIPPFGSDFSGHFLSDCGGHLLLQSCHWQLNNVQIYRLYALYLCPPAGADRMRGLAHRSWPA
ncbi:hypothetical protein DPEC_G00297840 [Dallia pectoralis]|uniref:Uncharacterized protein n=1 Tax=Dallia pectoralis TaxID=75939 RepID=A0ACC2FFU1_DALPE|nr:hypothetical protein DPEC_G00297840 [Dallia pectoralis]